MHLGKVIGSVVATWKDPNLESIKLRIVQPLNHRREEVQEPLVAVDMVGADYKETVFYVTSRDATHALPNVYGPVDAAVVGIVDRIDVMQKGNESL